MTLIQLHNDRHNRVITIASDTRIIGYNYFYYSIPKKYTILKNKIAVGACGYEIIINFIRHNLDITDKAIEDLDSVCYSNELTEDYKVKSVSNIMSSIILDPIRELLEKETNKEIPFEIIFAVNKYSFSIDSANMFLSNRLNDEYMCAGSNSAGLAAYKMLKRQKPTINPIDAMMDVFETVAEFNYSVAAPYSIDQIKY